VPLRAFALWVSFAGLSCASSSVFTASSASRFVSVPLVQQEAERQDVVLDERGAYVDREGQPNTAFCARLCGFAIEPSGRIVGCARASASEELKNRLGAPDLVVCEVAP
jgi:hypothetical protein